MLLSSYSRQPTPLFLTDHRRSSFAEFNQGSRYRPDEQPRRLRRCLRRADAPTQTGVPSNRFQIFQHNEADCCPKIPLRAPLPSLSRLSSAGRLSTLFTPVSLARFLHFRPSPLFLAGSPRTALCHRAGFSAGPRKWPPFCCLARSIFDTDNCGSNVHRLLKVSFSLSLSLSSLCSSLLPVAVSLPSFHPSRCHARGLFAHNPKFDSLTGVPIHRDALSSIDFHETLPRFLFLSPLFLFFFFSFFLSLPPGVAPKRRSREPDCSLVLEIGIVISDPELVIPSIITYRRLFHRN